MSYQKVKEWRQKNPDYKDKILKYSKRHRVVGYVNESTKDLVVALQFWNKESESKTIAKMIKKFFDQMPKEEKEKILLHFQKQGKK